VLVQSDREGAHAAGIERNPLPVLAEELTEAFRLDSSPVSLTPSPVTVEAAVGRG
jgi:hypothetical protein